MSSDVSLVSATSLSGVGTEESPYLIYTEDELVALATGTIDNALSAYYELQNDITLSSETWTPIGAEAAFTGYFDGRGFTITGGELFQSTGISGLFGINSGTIENLKVIANIDNTATNAGLLAGTNNGTIDNCSSYGEINTESNVSIGGLVGYNTGTIKNSSSCAVVTSTNGHSGGLVGINDSGTIELSYATGNVTSTSGNAGGLVGQLYTYPDRNTTSTAAVRYSYATGTVTVFGNDEPVIEKPCVTVGNAVGNAGDTIEIPVTLNNNTGFSSLGIEIGYDDTVLKLTNVNENSGVGASFTKAQYYTVKPYNIGWDSAANTAFNGTVATLTFEIISSDAGTYPITVDYYKGRNGNYVDGKNVNYDYAFNPLGLTYENGSVTVTGINAARNAANGSIDVRLFGGDITGKAVVGLYSSDGVLNDLKVYPAEENLNVTFDTGKTGAYAKIMWWENIDSMKPVCDAQIIPLQ